MTVAELTLASSSPRRRQLLEMLGIPVRVVPPNIPEVRREFETPVDYVERLAREKALSVPGELVLGADTTVVVGDVMLGKPDDAADARRMLELLSGRQHDVITGICLRRGPEIRLDHAVTTVWFATLSAGEIENYVASGEPMDNAGA